jgi:hypothetical protein
LPTAATDKIVNLLNGKTTFKKLTIEKILAIQVKTAYKINTRYGILISSRL